jgi:carboxyl-terminal processing protease
MRLTTERYYTPAGHAVQADGIHPDIHVNADDTTIPLVRERDLEGHLAGETPSSPAAPEVERAISADAGAAGARAARQREEDAEAEASGGSVAKVPVDPEKGSDEVLKVGYGVLVHAGQAR